MKRNIGSKMGDIPKAMELTLRRYTIGKPKLSTYQLRKNRKFILVSNEKKV